MEIKTINVKFDPSTLPRWAQNDGYVVSLAERDLAFRCNVCSAKTATTKQFLKREARRASVKETVEFLKAKFDLVEKVDENGVTYFG